MILRVSTLLARALVLLVAVAALALGFSAWLLMSGPVSVAWLTPYIERELSGEMAVVAIDDTQLRLGENQSLNLSAVGVRVRDRDGRLLGELREVEIGLSTTALLFERRIALRRIDAVAPSLLLTRRADGRIAFARGSASDQPAADFDLGALVGPLLTSAQTAEASAYLEHIRFSGGELILRDEAVGRTLKAREAELNVTGFGGPVSADLRFRIEQAARPASVEVLATREPGQDSTSIAIAVEHLLVAEFADLAPDLPLAGLDLALSGTLRTAVSATGAAAPIRFDLASDKGVVELPQLQPSTIPIEGLALRGSMAADREQVVIERLELSTDGAQLSGRGQVAWRGGEPTLTADLEAENATMAHVARFWPPREGREARAWVIENITGGAVPTARARLRFGPGELGQRPLPEHTLAGEFAFEDLTLRYVDTMPLLVGVSGRATFTAQRMEFAIGSGHVGDLRVDQGSVVITGIGIKGRDTTQLEIATRVAGPVQEALRLIDHPPLGFASKAGIAPEAASGQVVADLGIGMPLHTDMEPEEEARVAVDATIEDGALTRAPFELRDAQLQLTVAERTAELAGEAVLAGVPILLQVRETFDEAAGVDRRYHVEGSPDAALLSKFGVELPIALVGEVGVSATVTETPAARTAEIALDLTPTAIDVPELRWRKAAGEPGALTATATIPAEGPVQISRFALASPDLHAEGSFEAQIAPFRLARMRLDQVRLGETRAAIMLHPNGAAGYNVRIDADTIDLTPWLDEDGHGRTEAVAVETPLHVRLEAARLLLHDQQVRDVAAELVREPDGWRSADLRGHLAEGGEFALTLTPEGERQRLRLTSSDAGNLLQTLYRTGRVEGGSLELEATVFRQQPSLHAEGNLVARQFDVLDAPLLARLLTVASLTGIGNLLGGEGVAFEQLDARFIVRDEALQLDKGRVYGSQLGLTFNGRIDLAADALELEGTIAPLYGVNWTIGRIPIIGQLLRGSEAEGAFAATYTIRGPTDDPTIRVNPLSALTPGFLRELFSGLREGTLEPPEMLPSHDD